MSKCRICEYEGTMDEFTAYEMMYGTKDSFQYIRCPICNCLQIKDIPFNIDKYYSNNYYSYASLDGLKHTNNLLAEQPRILDIGCGSGAFLCALADDGYTQLYGCDPYIENDIFYPNGVTIYKRTIHEMDGKFDRLIMNDSFEHVPDPHEVMESANRLLAPGGLLQIKIPVFPNIAFDVFGVNWYQLDAPRHIFLHSKKSIQHLANKHGFNLVDYVWDSNNNQFMRSFLYSKGIPYIEQTPEIYDQFFTPEMHSEYQKQAKEADKHEYGDHAMFLLVKV